LVTVHIWMRRVYDKPTAWDGARILVDRVRPHRISRGGATAGLVPGEGDPSRALRRWFGHDPERWDAFKKR
jgi:uncharacterized protein YeaO (DUF488 family)